MAFAAVQRIGKGQASGATLVIGAGDGWATPAAGNLLVATANSDATVTMTTAGFTLGPSVIDGNGAYLWWKVAAGTESSITFTPGSSVPIAGTVCEYSGNAASPFDASNSSTIAGSAGTTTSTAAVTTTQDGDLIVGVAALHSAGVGTPSSPSWTNSFANQLSPNSGGGTSAHCFTFYSELTAGAAGSYSTVCSWTNNASDRQHLIIAFKEGAAAVIDAGGFQQTVVHPGFRPFAGAPYMWQLQYNWEPADTGNATVVATTVEAVADVPAVTVEAGTAATPATVAAVATVGAVAPQGGAAVAVATVAGVATIPAPTLTLAVATVAAVATVPAATAQGGAGVAPATVVGVAAVPAVTVRLGVLVQPATVAAVATVPSVAAQAGARPAPATVVGVATVGSPTLQAGAVSTPATVAAVAAVGSVSLGGSATVSAATVAAVASVPAVAVRLSVLITPATVAGTATVPAAAASGGARAVVATVPATATVPSVSVALGVAIARPTVTGTATIPAPTVRLSVAVPAATVTAVAAIGTVKLADVVVEQGNPVVIGAPDTATVSTLTGSDSLFGHPGLASLVTPASTASVSGSASTTGVT